MPFRYRLGTHHISFQYSTDMVPHHISIRIQLHSNSNRMVTLKSTIPISDLEPGDIVLVSKKHSLLAKLICRFSTTASDTSISKFSHTAIVVSTGTTKKIIEALSTGVKRSSLSKYSNGYRILIARHKELSFFNKISIVRTAEKYIGKKYGYKTLAGHFADYLCSKLIGRNVYYFRKIAGNNNFPICSWIVSHAYDRDGIRFLNLDPDLVQPDDIADEILNDKNNWEVVYSNLKL